MTVCHVRRRAACVVVVLLATGCAAKSPLTTLHRLEQAGVIVEEIQLAEHALYTMGTISAEDHTRVNRLMAHTAELAIAAITLYGQPSTDLDRQLALTQFVAAVQALASDAGFRGHERIMRLVPVILTLVGAVL